MAERSLKSTRVVELRTKAGPCLYVLEVFWHPGRGWETHSTYTSYTEAKRALHCMCEGIKTVSGDARQVVLSWSENGYAPDEVTGEGS